MGTDIEAARRAIERAVSVPHGDIRIDVDARAFDKNRIAVVVEIREMVTVGSVTAASGPRRATLRMDTAWQRGALKIVTFVQQHRSGRILGTAVLPLETVHEQPERP